MIQHKFRWILVVRPVFQETILSTLPGRWEIKGDGEKANLHLLQPQQALDYYFPGGTL